jgi:hypothetical protein
MKAIIIVTNGKTISERLSKKARGTFEETNRPANRRVNKPRLNHAPAGVSATAAINASTPSNLVRASRRWIKVSPSLNRSIK